LRAETALIVGRDHGGNSGKREIPMAEAEFLEGPALGSATGTRTSTSISSTPIVVDIKPWKN
jgi:hypothetical protein